jgi:uncharacterized protein
MEAVMAAPHPHTSFVVRIGSHVFAGAAVLAACVVFSVVATQAQESASQPTVPPARIIVSGEGIVTVPPDYAEIMSGVTTKATSAKEATDANSKQMAAINAALQNAGVEQRDIQTVRFSVQPVYGPPQPNSSPKVVAYSATNQLGVKIRQISKVGDILDALIAAGATDAGSVQFLHSDPSKALDQARQAAMTDARRKAELYAQAAGQKLGGVAWIAEEPVAVSPSPGIVRAYAAPPSVPIAAGEDTLQVRITVGFEFAR